MNSHCKVLWAGFDLEAQFYMDIVPQSENKQFTAVFSYRESDFSGFLNQKRMWNTSGVWREF